MINIKFNKLAVLIGCLMLFVSWGNGFAAEYNGAKDEPSAIESFLTKSNALYLNFVETELSNEAINKKIGKQIQSMALKGILNLADKYFPISSILAGGLDCLFGCEPEAVYTLEMQTAELKLAILESENRLSTLISDYFIQERQEAYDQLVYELGLYSFLHEWGGYQNFSSAELKMDNDYDAAYGLLTDSNKVKLGFESLHSTCDDLSAAYDTFHYYLNTRALQLSLTIDYYEMKACILDIGQVGDVDAGYNNFTNRHPEVFNSIQSNYINNSTGVLYDAFNHIKKMDANYAPHDKNWRAGSDYRFKNIANSPDWTDDYVHLPQDLKNFIDARRNPETFTLFGTPGTFSLTYNVTENKEYTIYWVAFANSQGGNSIVMFTPFNPVSFLMHYNTKPDGSAWTLRDEWLNPAIADYGFDCTIGGATKLDNGYYAAIGGPYFTVDVPAVNPIYELVEIHKGIEYIKYLQAALEPSIEIMEEWWEIGEFSGSRPVLQAETDLNEYYNKFRWEINEPTVVNTSFKAASDIIVNNGSLSINDNAEIKLTDGREFVAEEGSEMVITEGRIGFY